MVQSKILLIKKTSTTLMVRFYITPYILSSGVCPSLVNVFDKTYLLQRVDSEIPELSVMTKPFIIYIYKQFLMHYICLYTTIQCDINFNSLN